MKDSHHSYSYDQNGNLLQVDAAATASYIYDALNQRVQVKVAAATRNTLEFTYDFAGRRITTWDANANTGIQGQAWLGSQPLAYRDSDGTTYFQQADWVGTQRLLTNHAGSNVSAYRSNPFGDGYSASGKDDNTQHYAGLEHDAESATDHAQFRQYNTNLGQWMSLDPYRGSYDFLNPQSYNRYTYAMNNPLSLIDPADLRCVTLDNGVVGDDGEDPPCGSAMTPGTGPDATVFGGIVPWFIQEYGFTPGWLQSVAPIASDTSILPSRRSVASRPKQAGMPGCSGTPGWSQRKSKYVQGLFGYLANNPLSYIDPWGLALPYRCETTPDKSSSSSSGIGSDGSIVQNVSVTSGTQTCTAQEDGLGGPTMNIPKVSFEPFTDLPAPNNGVPRNPCSEAGGAPDPSYYTNRAKQTLFNPAKLANDLSQFPRGRPLDAQPLGGSRAYGNYVYGAYLRAADVPLFVALSGADAYAFFSRAQYGDLPRTTLFPFIPADNVANITAEYNAAGSGTLCHK